MRIAAAIGDLAGMAEECRLEPASQDSEYTMDGALYSMSAPLVRESGPEVRFFQF